MPKIDDKGIIRDMTEEEIAEMERRNAEFQQSQPSLEEQIAELQEALDLLLSGVTE